MYRHARALAGLVSASILVLGGRAAAQCSASLTSERGDRVTAVAGNQLFVVDCEQPYLQAGNIDRYDPSTGSWSNLDLARPRSLFATTAANGVVLFAGGYELSAGAFTGDVELYDTLTGTWSTGTLAEIRADVTAAAVGSKALFAGGATGLLTSSAHVDVYDTVTGAWTSASLSQARREMSVAVTGDLLILAGGWTAPSGATTLVPSDAVDIFDAASGQWSSATLVEPRVEMATTSVGTTALFAGGWSAASPWVESDAVDAFDGASGSWSSAALSSPRVWLAATALGGKAYFAGGWSPDPSNPPFGAPTAAIDVFDPSTSSWSLEQLSEHRYDVGAVTFGARAYFAGGSIGLHAHETIVDVFDSATGAWSQQELGEPRGKLAAVALANRVLFVGGDGAFEGGPGDMPGPFPYPSAYVDIVPAGGPRPFCFGSGAAVSCGCGNTSAGAAGCANSSGAGATLTSAGCTSMNAEDVRLQAGAMPVGALALLFVGDHALGGGAGVPFGDGLRCVGGGVARLGTRTAGADGAAEWGPGLADSAGFGVGEVRRFQAFYRDAGSPCGFGFNASNGLEVELGA